MLQPGDKAPAFSLLDQTGTERSLAEFAGAPLLVYFYPKADTPGCTVQSCAVRDAAADLAQARVAAVGISPDTPERQKKFDVKYTLGFPLLADTDHAVAEAFGVWGEKKRGGRTSMGIRRSAFLISAGGAVEQTWYDVRPADTVPNLLAAIRR